MLRQTFIVVGERNVNQRQQSVVLLSVTLCTAVVIVKHHHSMTRC